MDIFTYIYIISGVLVCAIEANRFGTNIVPDALDTKTKLENIVQYISMVFSILVLAIIPVLNTIYVLNDFYQYYKKTSL
jgi:uncharacterized membrane protein YcgQ (UPF0703/DUF1980 family)